MRFILAGIILMASCGMFLYPVLFTSSEEDKVCKCIVDKFKEIDIDYLKFIDEVESDLIKNKIIDESIASKIEKIQLLSNGSTIDGFRTYENVFVEPIVMNIISGCVSSATKDSLLTSFDQMFKDLDVLYKSNQNNQVDLKILRQKTAQILIKYINELKNETQLSRIILLQYLYFFIDLDPSKFLIDLPSWSDETNELGRYVNIQIGINDILTLDNEVIDTSKLCEILKPKFLEKLDIALASSENTKYMVYLNMFNKLQDCLLSARNEKSNEFYNKTYAELSEKEKISIDELIPTKIIDKLP